MLEALEAVKEVVAQAKATNVVMKMMTLMMTWTLASAGRQRVIPSQAESQ